MSRYPSHDHYLDPASGVLKNRLGITDAATLEKAEAALVATRSFVSHLAHAAGYYLAWENVKQPDMLQASIESFQGDTSKLAALIHENLHTLDRDASAPAQGPRQKPPKPKLP